MLQYLIGITDNTLISAVMIAMLLSVISKKGLNTKRIALYGFIFGFIIALIYACLKRTTGFAVREFYDLGILVVLLAITFPLFIMIWLKAKDHSTVFIRSLLSVLSAVFLLLLTAQFIPNILLFPFGFSVGMGSIFNTDFLYKVTGYLIAIILMLILAVFIYRAAKRLSTFFVLTLFSVMLTVFTLQSIINVVQILIVRSLIARQDWLMRMVMFILSHINLFMYLFIILTTLLAIAVLIKIKLTSLVGNNPAQIRKMKAEHRRDRRAAITVLCGLTISMYTITRARYIFERGVELSPAKELFVTDGLIVIPLEEVSDGNLHRFSYRTSDGTLVRFIVIKKSENAYGVGLDACDICGASGYYQRGNQVVCILCDVVMNIATIGFPGGCNPVPLKFLISDGRMVIKPVYLEAEKSRFK